MFVYFLETGRDLGSNSQNLGNDEEIIDWSKFNLAKQAFQTCETDGEEGLTWDEVDSCEVRVCRIACPSFSTYKSGKNTYDS